MIAVSKQMIGNQLSELESGHKTGLFSSLKLIINGKNSVLKAIMMFTMQNNLYNMKVTHLDEVSIALERAIDGLNYFVAATQTICSQIEDVVQPFKEIEYNQRYIAYGLSKTAARLVHDRVEKEYTTLDNFKVLNYGILSHSISNLSDECKEQLKGSYEILRDTGSEYARELFGQPSGPDNHS